MLWWLKPRKHEAWQYLYVHQSVIITIKYLFVCAVPCKNVLGSSPQGSWGFSVWSLHVLPGSAQVLPTGQRHIFELRVNWRLWMHHRCDCECEWLFILLYIPPCTYLHGQTNTPQNLYYKCCFLRFLHDIIGRETPQITQSLKLSGETRRRNFYWCRIKNSHLNGFQQVHFRCVYGDIKGYKNLIQNIVGAELPKFPRHSNGQNACWGQLPHISKQAHVFMVCSCMCCEIKTKTFPFEDECVSCFPVEVQ